MQCSYDPQYNIAYVALRSKVKGVETRRVNPELRADIGAKGKLYGIALFSPKKQLAKENVRAVVQAVATAHPDVRRRDLWLLLLMLQFFSWRRFRS